MHFSRPTLFRAHVSHLFQPKGKRAEYLTRARVSRPSRGRSRGAAAGGGADRTDRGSRSRRSAGALLGWFGKETGPPIFVGGSLEKTGTLSVSQSGTSWHGL